MAAPCIGPFVLGLLTWVAGSGSALLGFAVFFALSLGLGLPLLFLALFSGRLERLPRTGEWMVWVRRLMGWVLVGMAFHFARPLFAADIGLFLLAAVALVAGIDLGWRTALAGGSRSFALLRFGVGVFGILLALTLAGGRILHGPGLPWHPYSDELIAAARRDGRAVFPAANWREAAISRKAATAYYEERHATKTRQVIMMHWGSDMPGWGGHLFGGLLMLLFWMLVIVGIVALVSRVLSRSAGGPPATPESPLEILKRRYAKGEIDKAEFEEKRKDILRS